MRKTLRKISHAVHRRLSLKVLIGGPAGLCAWGLSGAGALAALVWGLKAIALPLVMIKTVSWSLWGAGVLHQSWRRKRTLEAEGREANGGGWNS